MNSPTSLNVTKRLRSAPYAYGNREKRVSLSIPRIILCMLAITAAALTATAQTQTPPLAGTWIVEDIGGAGVLDAAESSVTFEADGKIFGRGGCNKFRGNAQIGDGSVQIGPLGGTKMMCTPALMTQETRFLAALETARSFKIDSAFLRIYDANGSELLRLVRKT